jgi:hypothetical protein
LPAGGGASANKAALAGSRVVQVAPGTSSGRPWQAASPTPWTGRPGNSAAIRAISSPASSTGLAVPLPAHSRNSTGRHTGEEQKGSLTAIPATTHRLPRPIFCLPWAAPS